MAATDVRARVCTHPPECGAKRSGKRRPQRGTNPRATTITRQKKRGTRAGDSVTDRVSCACWPPLGGREAQGRAQAATGNSVPAVSALWVTNVVDVCRVVADARKSDDWAPVTPFPSVGSAAGALLSVAVSRSGKDCGTRSDFFTGPLKDNADRVFSLFFSFYFIRGSNQRGAVFSFFWSARWSRSHTATAVGSFGRHAATKKWRAVSLCRQEKISNAKWKKNATCVNGPVGGSLVYRKGTRRTKEKKRGARSPPKALHKKKRKENLDRRDDRACTPYP